MCKTWFVSHPELQSVFRARVLALPRVTQTQWRVDYTLRSSEAAVIEEPSVRVKLTTDKPVEGWRESAGGLSQGGRAVAFEASAEGFAVLLGELKQARAALQALARE